MKFRPDWTRFRGQIPCYNFSSIVVTFGNCASASEMGKPTVAAFPVIGILSNSQPAQALVLFLALSSQIEQYTQYVGYGTI